MIRILIVDDQNLVQQGIKSLLDRDVDLKVIGTVKDGRHAVQQIAQIHPDIVLLDIEMPGMDGITTTKYINRVSPKTKVIILSSHEEKKYVTQALMAGAKGYLLKSSLMNDLKQAILAVNNGYSQIDSRLLAKVFDPQNIKAKKKDLRPEISLTKEKASDQQTLPQPLPDRHQVNRHVEPEQLKNSVHSVESDRTVLPPKTQTTTAQKSTLIESDTPIPSETSQVISEASVERSPQQTRSDEVADYSSLKQVEPDGNSTQSTKASSHQKRSPALVSQGALAPIKRKSVRRRRKTKFLDRVFARKIAPIVRYATRLSDHPKMLVYKPKITRLRSRLKRYQTQLSSSIDRKGQQGMLWNIGLVIFGMVVVIIFSRL